MISLPIQFTEGRLRMDDKRFNGKFLQHYINEEKIDQINKEYFNTWKFRHPEPKDYFSIFKKYG